MTDAARCLRSIRCLSMELSRNRHRLYHTTVEAAIDDEEHGYHPDDWISDEQRDRAVAANECWTLQWYPRTSVGFLIASAADLDALLEHVLGQTSTGSDR